ncbi:fumarylacetoacetate hydrolase family protein [Phenylobacterium sp.]|uniref:fumarylacetoacetate hydrolase family protein n=1 Tax=Phenylobacterium sp. TaxID=1871053 RepID=UPI0035B1FA60
MRIVRYRLGADEKVGLLEGDEIVPVAGADCASFVVGTPATLVEDPGAPRVRLDQVQVLAPIVRGRFFCIGLNYQAHVAEVARDPAERPSVFTRTRESLAGPGDSLWRPKVSEQFDYEGELAAVIGKAGRHISTEDALDHVFGYTCFLDGSVRDFQKHSVTAGKNFERTGAIGPWIVSRDEAPQWNAMTLVTRLNGAVVQQTSTSLMIYGLPELVSYLSTITTLAPGDVIATGTPSGVGARRTPPLWMHAGDRIDVTVDGVGALVNDVVDEPEFVPTTALVQEISS